MLGLLVEYVADARSDESADRARQQFLGDLSAELADLAASAEELADAEVIAALRAIRDQTDAAFAGDEVLGHVDACIEELERIRRQSR